MLLQRLNFAKAKFYYAARFVWKCANLLWRKDQRHFI